MENDEKDRYSVTHIFKGVDKDKAFTNSSISYFKLVKAIKEDIFSAYFSEIIGENLVIGENQVITRAFYIDDYVKPHNDRILNRNCCVNFYFSTFDDFEGGTLHAKIDDSIISIIPKDNRCVFLNPYGQQVHWISPIEKISEDKVRYSVTWWGGQSL